MGPADFFFYADVAELADALGSGPSGRKVVEVQVLSSAPKTALSHQHLASRFLSKVAASRLGPLSRPRRQTVRTPALCDAVLANLVEQCFVADLQQHRGLFAIPVSLVEGTGDSFRLRLVFGIA